jgi:hypothetical protein
MKDPRKGEKKKQGARTKVQAANSPKVASDPEEREPPKTETSTSHMKRVNLY